MATIIDWPRSQICMDCTNSQFVNDPKTSSRYICQIHEYPDCNGKCEKHEEQTVELISSGYEWTCPVCDTLSTVIETTESVTCEACEREFKVDSYAHVHP